MKNPAEQCIDAQHVRLLCLIDLGLNFSTMLRSYERGSKEKLYKKVLREIPGLLRSENEFQFHLIHSSICEWGTSNVLLNEGLNYASYGQIAKTLDVTLKVVIDFGHMPDCHKAKQMSPWLNAAVDTKMMNMLKKNYPNEIKPWPQSVRQVNRENYFAMQNLVRRFNSEKHNNRITPVQFDDIYWWFLNKDNKYGDNVNRQSEF